jgi:ABC-type multidrug transport system fused ATPase/permease subunit
VASLRASRVLFEKLTFTIMRAPLRWLDTVPTGRILNRFSKDFEVVDIKLSNDVAFLVYRALALLGVVAAG